MTRSAEEKPPPPAVGAATKASACTWGVTCERGGRGYGRGNGERLRAARPPPPTPPPASQQAPAVAAQPRSRPAGPCCLRPAGLTHPIPGACQLSTPPAHSPIPIHSYPHLQVSWLVLFVPGLHILRQLRRAEAQARGPAAQPAAQAQRVARRLLHAARPGLAGACTGKRGYGSMEASQLQAAQLRTPPAAARLQQRGSSPQPARPRPAHRRRPGSAGSAPPQVRTAAWPA